MPAANVHPKLAPTAQRGPVNRGPVAEPRGQRDPVEHREPSTLGHTLAAPGFRPSVRQAGHPILIYPRNGSERHVVLSAPTRPIHRWIEGRPSIGFGFYSQCLVRPRAYPVYYPVYAQPVVVSSPTHVSYPEYISSPTYVAASTGSVPSLPIDQLKGMMADGTRFFQQGSYAQAADRFMRVASADPQNVDARLAYAVARFATGDYQMSAAAVRQGVQMFPEVVNSVFDVRGMYGNPADFDQQWQHLAQRLQDQPDDSDALLVLGFVYHFVGDREHAAEVFSVVNERSQGDTDIAQVFLNARPLPQITGDDTQTVSMVAR